MKKITVCTTCGSPRVTFDAVVDPNNDNAILTIFDNSDCRDCDGECDTREVEVLNDFDMEHGFWKEGMYSAEQIANEPRICDSDSAVGIGERIMINGVTLVVKKEENGCKGCIGNKDGRTSCEKLPPCGTDMVFVRPEK